MVTQGVSFQFRTHIKIYSNNTLDYSFYEVPTARFFVESCARVSHKIITSFTSNNDKMAKFRNERIQ